ncbi:MAG TPA: glucose-1-phosphate thymidylyltransferase RfbA [Hyphomonadaceae bacterium]|nr:glucose-1-phosphate thymidylyltransferase RfbA [Hyphomonadaceae bacterium]
MAKAADKTWKAILLAGGSGSRLYPLTLGLNKHLLPVYDKPMIYYSLSTLMLGGLRDIIIMSGKDAIPQFQRLLGDGSQWGLQLSYMEQAAPNGIAECFRIAQDEIRGHNVALMLGDNIFYSDKLGEKISAAMAENAGATIFACEVANPSEFGVVELDDQGRPISLEEKPKQPRTNLAVPGFYCYDERVVDMAWKLKPGPRGELEITDINRAYLQMGELNVKRFGRGIAWLDGGTHAALYDAGQFIKVVEERTGLKIACPEEIAFRQGYITAEDVMRLAGASKTPYADYLRALVHAPSSET